MEDDLERLRRARRSQAMVRVGDAIREARERKRITLRALATAIKVSAPFLSDVEHGRRMALRHLPNIARALKMPLAALEANCGLCPHCEGTGLTEPNEGE